MKSDTHNPEWYNISIKLLLKNKKGQGSILRINGCIYHFLSR